VKFSYSHLLFASGLFVSLFFIALVADPQGNIQRIIFEQRGLKPNQQPPVALDPLTGLRSPKSFTKLSNPTGTPTSDDLQRGLKSSNVNDRIETLKTLIQQQERVSELIPDVIITLKDKNAGVRQLSATALQWSGEADSVVISALTQNLTDPEPIVQQAASSAIAYLSKADIKATELQKLLPLLNQPNSEPKSNILLTIANMEHPSQEAVPYLIPLLKDQSSDLRLKTIDALRNIGEASTIAIPYLIPLLKDPNQDVQRNARATLATLGVGELNYGLYRIWDIPGY
jgi:HEAT repeat protein